jgi:hypothetical protein
MLRTIKLWTSGHYLLKAVEASSPNNGHKFIYVSSQMKWAIRAIHDGITTLTYDDLVDFISTTRYKTYSYFKMKTDQTEKDLQKVFFVCLWNGSFDQSNVADG